MFSSPTGVGQPVAFERSSTSLNHGHLVGGGVGGIYGGKSMHAFFNLQIMLHNTSEGWCAEVGLDSDRWLRFRLR